MNLKINIKPTLLAGFFSLCICSSFAQVSDNFNDSNFNSNPRWYGDTAKFSFSGGKLRTGSTTANDKFYISTQSKLVANTIWSFFINLQFNTSSLNYVDVFLTSDSSSLAGQNSGYFVRIGGTNDEICLYKKNKSISTLLIDGRNGILNKSNNIYKIKVICDSNYNFTLYRDSTGLGNNFTTEGSVKNSDFISSEFAGILVKQSTSGFFKLHFIDDFEISKIYKDTISPFVKNAESISLDTFTVSFSEKMNISALVPSNFEIDKSIGKPYTARFTDYDSSVVELIFSNKILPNSFYNLSIKNCEDKAGLKAKDTSFSIIRYKYEIPEQFDLLITEIMADPEPQVGLPNAEFIEIFNNSSKIITLKNCRIHDMSSYSVLPDIQIYPDSFLILCEKNNYSLFEKYGKTYGLSYFPSLNNSGDEISLRNNEGKLVHRISYSTSTYNDNLKSNGGWSLEMIDKTNPCNESNFTSSVNPDGGTPGNPNSVDGKNPDISKPFVLDFFVKNDLKIVVEMSENVDSISAVDSINVLLNSGFIKAIFKNQNKIEIALKSSLKAGEKYILTLKKMKDCSGNILNDTSINFTLPEIPKQGELILNEILFNPEQGGCDYIEIFNTTEKTLWLRNVYIFNHNSNNQPDNFTAIDTSGKYILPKSFKVITTNRDWVCSKYKFNDKTAFVQLPEMPAMNDDYGYIGISDFINSVIDEMYYSDAMHFELLTEKEGVSLEKINQMISSTLSSNWSSAAATYGFGTPGLENSHNLKLNVPNSFLTILPEMFSPDDDGNDDLVSITLNSNKTTSMATVIIFDANGLEIKKLANNEPAGNTQTWFWNGIDNSGKKAPIGIYIAYAELFGIDGKKQIEKKTLTLGGK